MTVTRGRWIAGATVLAVAAASGLVGHRIAERDGGDDVVQVRTLPVLGPVDSPPIEPVTSGEVALAQSPVQAVRDVRYLDGEPQLGDDRISDVLASPDPSELIDPPTPGDGDGLGTPSDEAEAPAAGDAPTLRMPELGWVGLSDWSSTDDPCAPVEGAPASDCPDGVGAFIGPWPLPRITPGTVTSSDAAAGGESATDTDDQVGAGRSGLTEQLPPPPTTISGLTAGLMVLTAPHRGDVRVNFNVQLLDPGEEPDCSAPGDDLPLAHGGVDSGTIRVEESWLREHRYDPSFTKRSTIIVMVPEGRRILGCIAEFDGDRPSWNWNRAQRRTWRVLESPDLARPSITADVVGLAGSLERDSVEVVVKWPNVRASCTVVRGPSRAGNVMAEADHDAVCNGDEFGITGGDAVVSTRVRYDDTLTVSESILPLGAVNCGGCIVPTAKRYDIPLRIETGPVRMCGSGIQAPCDPLAANESVGTAHLRVTWEPGASNGREWWGMGEQVHEDVEQVLDPLPQIETINEQTTFTTTGATQERRGHVEGRYRLVVDRPVDYRVTVDGGCWVGEAMSPLTGHTDAAVELTFPRMCFDVDYGLTITLTDEAGTTVTYDRTDWLYGTFRTPKWQRSVAIGYTVRVELPPTDAYLVERVLLRLGDRTIDLTPPEGERCFFTDVLDVDHATTAVVGVGQQTPVSFEVDVVPTRSEDGVCRRPPYDYYDAARISARIDMAQWALPGQTVAIDMPRDTTPRIDTSGTVRLTPKRVARIVDSAPNIATRR
ncbi:MAG TPA: hypothetical protein VNZ66_00705 [Aeromicrobium sp.]|nr:hypothetical protein [Aeromicrobium sp.]